MNALGDDRHRDFLNRYYGVSRHFYDVTRKYYLFGRDTVLQELARDRSWRTLVEIGPGTGRNLRWLHRRRPDAKLGGLEASDAMLAHARKRCPWARLEQGFAESADLSRIHGTRPDIVLYSYCLSMVEARDAALDNAQASLASGGRVVLVDFGDFQRLPPFVAPRMVDWLRTFHVDPVDPRSLDGRGGFVRWGRGRYWFSATLPSHSKNSSESPALAQQ